MDWKWPVLYIADTDQSKKKCVNLPRSCRSAQDIHTNNTAKILLKGKKSEQTFYGIYLQSN